MATATNPPTAQVLKLQYTEFEVHHPQCSPQTPAHSTALGCAGAEPTQLSHPRSRDWRHPHSLSKIKRKREGKKGVCQSVCRLEP